MFGPWIMYYSRSSITRTRITRIPRQLELNLTNFLSLGQTFTEIYLDRLKFPADSKCFSFPFRVRVTRGSTVNDFNPKYFKYKWALTKGMKCTGIYARSASINLVGRFSDLESSSGPAWRDVYWNMTLKIIARWHKKIWHNNKTIHRSRGSRNERSQYGL